MTLSITVEKAAGIESPHSPHHFGDEGKSLLCRLPPEAVHLSTAPITTAEVEVTKKLNPLASL
jgi:hypothetical protein